MFLDIEKKIEFILEAYRNTHNMIAFADTKASISLSIQSLLISIGLGTSLLSNTFNNVQKINDGAISCFFYSIVVLLVVSSILGIIQSVCVYRARSPLDKKEQNRKGLLYFGHIAKFQTFEDFYSNVYDIDDEGVLNEFSHQVYHLSLIAKKKMESVNRSIYFLIINLFLTITLIILSGYINSLDAIILEV